MKKKEYGEGIEGRNSRHKKMDVVVGRWVGWGFRLRWKRKRESDEAASRRAKRCGWKSSEPQRRLALSRAARRQPNNSAPKRRSDGGRGPLRTQWPTSAVVVGWASGTHYRCNFDRGPPAALDHRDCWVSSERLLNAATASLA